MTRRAICLALILMLGAPALAAPPTICSSEPAGAVPAPASDQRHMETLWQLAADAMVGPFASVRFDMAWLTMTDTRRDKWVGGNVGLSFVGNIGWRFAIGHFETTPSFGLGTRTDFDPKGRLAPWTRAVIRFDWTMGWMF